MAEVSQLTDEELDQTIMGDGIEEQVSPTDNGESEEATLDEEVDNDVGQSTPEDEISEEEQPVDDLDSTDTEDTPNTDDESVDDDTDTVDDTSKEDTEDNVIYQPLRANGTEYPIDSLEELYKLASAGAGAVKKFQAISKHRKTILMAEKADVSMEDAVNLMAQYKDNPKAVIRQLLEQSDIHPEDIDLEEPITGSLKDYKVSDFEVSYKNIVDEIGDSTVFPKVQEVIMTTWDEKSRDMFFEDPNMITALHEEMQPLEGSDKSLFDLVSPIAAKMKLTGDTRTDYEIYMEARAKKVEEFNNFEDVKTQENNRPKTKAKAPKTSKKRASPSGSNISTSNITDVSSLSDSELDAFLDKLDKE